MSSATARRVTAQDTVPFALWTAATFLDNYPAAVIACVQVGDVDTTAATVDTTVAENGGLGDRADTLGTPAEWLAPGRPIGMGTPQRHRQPRSAVDHLYPNRSDLPPSGPGLRPLGATL